MIVKIPLSLSNAYLIKGKHPILIDTGSPNDAQRLEKALYQLDVAPSDLALIIHTHAHFDHCGTTNYLKKVASKVPTLAHAADTDFLKKGYNQNIRPSCLLGYIAKPFLSRRYTPFTPDIVIDAPINLDAFGYEAMVVPTPGHTEGSISVVFKNGDAVVGDLMAGNIFAPQKADYHVFIDDKNENNRSIKRVVELGAKQFFVGHGGPFPISSVFKRLDKKCFL